MRRSAPRAASPSIDVSVRPAPREDFGPYEASCPLSNERWDSDAGPDVHVVAPAQCGLMFRHEADVGGASRLRQCRHAMKARQGANRSPAWDVQGEC